MTDLNLLGDIFLVSASCNKKGLADGRCADVGSGIESILLEELELLARMEVIGYELDRLGIDPSLEGGYSGFEDIVVVVGSF